MAARTEPGWKTATHEADLEWVTPLDHDDFVNANFGAERRAFLDRGVGMYLWRVKTWGGFARENLYVGQTVQGFGTRTGQHLKGNLGKKLSTLKADGKEPYIFCAAITCTTAPSGRARASFVPLLLDSIERALIWNLRPKWNTYHTVTSVIPLHVRIESFGEVPGGVPRVISMEAREHHRGI